MHPSATRSASAPFALSAAESGSNRAPAPREQVSERSLILIAEDHADSRDALRALLEVYGYRVEAAANGREAVDRAIEVRPDLVLMDIMMPEMDGFEATRRLRASDRFGETPILALTAMEGARDMVLAAGCDDYLPKPIDVRTFLDRVSHWLKSGRATHG